MWRVLTGRHKSISLNFLNTGHTKFAPDWCFGLLKQKFCKEPVSRLKEMEATVSKPVKCIKQFHHFSFSHQAKGVVMATTHTEGPTQILPVLVGDAEAVPHAPPPPGPVSWLSAQRQLYLFKSIRDFCTEETKDTMCPKPTVPEPGPTPPTRHREEPLAQGEADPEG